jgi:hypothetical protein
VVPIRYQRRVCAPPLDQSVSATPLRASEREVEQPPVRQGEERYRDRDHEHAEAETTDLARVEVAAFIGESAPAPIIAPETVAESTAKGDKPPGFEDGNYRSRTRLGNYRPFRHRRGPNRAVPLDTKRTANEAKEAAAAR